LFFPVFPPPLLLGGAGKKKKKACVGKRANFSFGGGGAMGANAPSIIFCT